jgi:hypothetical protein
VRTIRKSNLQLVQLILDIDYPPYEALSPAAQIPWDIFQSTPDMNWTLSSPRNALGQRTAIEVSYGSVTSSSNFSVLLRHCFDPEFLACYSFLVNPNIPALLFSSYTPMSSFGSPNATNPGNVPWETLAERRAYCGTFVLQYLMEKRFKTVWHNVKHCPEQEKLPLFLIVTGTLIAAAATRNLPYIKVSAKYNKICLLERPLSLTGEDNRLTSTAT